jgi:hypothetical protein
MNPYPFVIASALCLLITTIVWVVAVKLVMRDHLVIASLCMAFSIVVLAFGVAMVEQGLEAWRISHMPVVQAPPLRNECEGRPCVDHVIPLQPSAPNSWVARPDFQTPVKKGVRVGPMT